MNRTVQNITRKLTGFLPENEQYYRLDELRDWQFPAFIVKRIRIELERNLAESMILPETDWANKESEAVQLAWQQFVEAIHAEARLPASYAKAVIETAVADVLEMLVQPRKNIPEVIFATDEKLKYKQLTSRVESVVVYKHFITILLRYMEKREAKELTKTKCREIVSMADEKMTKRYSPLNWAQMIDPLFSLLDNSIDTDLLRLFFEDKNMPREARRFDLMEGEVTRAQLIETLSSPELLNFEGYEEDQSSLFDRLKTRQKESVSTKTGQDDNITDSASATTPVENKEEVPADNEDSLGIETKEEIEVQKEREEVSDEENSLYKTFTGEDEDPVTSNKNDDEEPDESLNSIFQEEDKDVSIEKTAHSDEKEEDVENIEEEDQKVSAYDIDSFRKRKTVETEVTDKTGNAGAEDKENQEGTHFPEAEESKPFEEIKGEDDIGETMLADFEGELEPKSSEDPAIVPQEGEETPMWMRFIDPDKLAEEEEQEEQLSFVEDNDESATSDEDKIKEDTVEDGFIDEPIVDLTKEERSSGGEDSQERDKLYNQLSSDQELFVNEIFGGSEHAFEEAVDEISAFKNWKSASKYIEKNVFKRNLVDMYSEAAVDFTDRLQSYFLEKQKQN